MRKGQDVKVEFNDVELSYVDRGIGLPILFVHGFPLDGTLWQPQLDGLSDEYRVIVPDLRGFGGSTVSLAMTMEQYADDLRLLLDELGIEEVVLAGLSMGGYIAFAFCRKYSGRLRGLVLADTRPQADSDEARANRTATGKQVIGHGAAALADSMLDKLLSPATFKDQPDLVSAVRDMMARQSVFGIVAALYGMSERPDASPLLGEISVPTLVVVGADDVITPVAEAESMVESIPGSELLVIPDAGHLSNLEQPEAFNQALRDFLVSRVEGA
ncbi:MAG: alpha/beta fold hydrolase [Anaerolineae bacterium]